MRKDTHALQLVKKYKNIRLVSEHDNSKNKSNNYQQGGIEQRMTNGHF